MKLLNLATMRLMTIPFAFIIPLSVATTHISAIKGQGVSTTIE